MVWKSAHRVQAQTVELMSYMHEGEASCMMCPLPRGKDSLRDPWGPSWRRMPCRTALRVRPPLMEIIGRRKCSSTVILIAET